MKNIDPSKLIDVEIDGINIGDSPDFVDAYLSYACHCDGSELSELELEYITDTYPDWILNQVNNIIY